VVAQRQRTSCTTHFQAAVPVPACVWVDRVGLRPRDSPWPPPPHGTDNNEMLLLGTVVRDLYHTIICTEIENVTELLSNRTMPPSLAGGMGGPAMLGLTSVCFCHKSTATNNADASEKFVSKSHSLVVFSKLFGYHF
jgi:hypothetical protein